MSIDFSFLKNIDFQNTNNIIFLFIIVILFVIIFSVFLLILIKIIKGIKKIFLKIFKKKKKPAQFLQEESTNIIRGRLNMNQVSANIPGEKMMAGDFMIIPNRGNEADDKNNNSEVKKESKDIVAGLSKLKSNNPNNPDKKDTLQSKMPSRTKDEDVTDNKPIKIARLKKGQKTEDVLNNEKTNNKNENQENNTEEKNNIVKDDNPLGVKDKDIDNQPIKIPRPKELQEDNVGSDRVAVPTTQGKNDNAQTYKSPALTQSPSFANKPGFIEDKYGVHSAHENLKNKYPNSSSKIASLLEKPGFIEDKYGVHSAGINAQKEETKPVEQKDETLFSEKQDLTRREMASKLKNIQKTDEYMRIERDLGLSMSRQQMGDLVQKYFPKIYGSNISKDEFRRQINILNKTPIDDVSKRAQVRREIKLLKKIGGIK